MKIKTQLLRNAVDTALPLTRENKAVPIVACFKLMVEGNQLKLSSSSFDEWLTLNIDCISVDPINVCVNAKKFQSALVLGAEEVELLLDKSHMTVKSLASCKLSVMDAAEFSPIPNISEAETLDSIPLLYQGVKAVRFCAHQEEGRMELHSVHVIGDGTQVKCEASDGGNGAFFMFDSPAKFGVLISSEFVDRFASAIAHEKSAVSFNNRLVSATWPGGSYCCKQLEAKYPDTKRILDGDDYKPTITVGEIPHKEIAATLDVAMALFDTNKTPAVELSFDGDGVSLKTDNLARVIPGKFGVFKTNINANSLRRCLLAFGDDKVTLASCKVGSVRMSSGNLTVISMPLREK